MLRHAQTSKEVAVYTSATYRETWQKVHQDHYPQLEYFELRNLTPAGRSRNVDAILTLVNNIMLNLKSLRIGFGELAFQDLTQLRGLPTYPTEQSLDTIC